MIRRLHLPMLEPEDVVRHLGKEEKHWREKYSAHALANTWFDANSIPPAICSALSSNPVFQSAVLIDAFLEREVDLRSVGRPSQTDLLAVIGLNTRLAILAIEGKVDEPFGQLVQEWLAGNKDREAKPDRPAESKTRKARLDGLCHVLKLNVEKAKPLRYQLLHRTVSALFEAKRYRTDLAAMVVHSFSTKQTGLDDFQRFVCALGIDGDVQPGRLVGPLKCEEGVSLFLGWVQDSAPESKGHLDDLRKYTQRHSDWCARVRAFCDARSSNGEQ